MKRIKSLLIFLLIIFSLQSQNITVESFGSLTKDLTANIEGTKRFDANTRKNAALIKIETTVKDLHFDGGMMGLVGDPVYKIGEVWVYVPEGAKNITIQHSELGVLRNYYYPESILSGKTYLMKLSTAKVVTYIEEDLGGDYIVMNITPANSKVIIDDNLQDVDSDGNLTSFLPYGTHTYSVSSNMYKTDMGSFIINKDGKTTLSVNLEPQFSYLQINSEPEGAEVYIDNSTTSAGVTPFKSGPLAYGTHTLQYRKAKYNDKYVEVEVLPGVTPQNITHSLVPNFASVSLSVPNNAEIYVNNEKKGESAWNGELRAGSYLVEARKESHHSTKTTISVQAGVPVDKTLEAPIPRYGTLQIESLPVGSTIEVDRKEVGTTPLILKNILIGDRNITIRKQGYEPSAKTLYVEEGKVVQEKFTLQKSKMPKTEVAVKPGQETGNRGYSTHEYVDLGLPSGIKWATCNVGANSPEEYGDYYAWGETEPNTTYDWSTYKYCNGSSTTLTKYCVDSYYGTVDNKTVLELEDDAACINWGGNWRMPTEAEQYELRDTNNCTWEWITQNGVKGYKVTSKVNGNSIFLPAAGYSYYGNLYNAGSYGNYWSSSLYTDYTSNAYDLYFGSSDVGWSGDYRYYGRSVRAVCE